MKNDVLTIGMATRGEFDSVYFTLSALAANHPKCQYLVVDNTPEYCPRTEAITRAVGGRYMHRPDLTGTSKPRDAVFRFAQTPWVMCVDSHVVFEHFADATGRQTSAVERFLQWIDNNPQSRDLVQGPMIADDGIGVFSHWTQPAPPGLWGEWGSAFVDNRGTVFTFGRVENGYARYTLSGKRIDVYQPVDDPPKHYGWKRLPPDTLPFEIAMLGLGCWAMRKDAWPGFPYLFQGFGGEEGYIHEKVRRAGGKCLLLPFLRWRHKFRDVGGWDKNPVPYPLRLEDHTWNLLIGHRELGIEAVDRIYDHFGKRMEAAMWSKLVEVSQKMQPIGSAVTPTRQTILAVWYTDNTAPPDLMARSLQTVANAVANTQRHTVKVITVGWDNPAGNPFPFIRYEGERKRSHATLVRQILQGMGTQANALDKPAAVSCLEHDVLYPANYFDRVGDMLAFASASPVVSNLDYIGLNETGWLAVRERHEPMHQLTIRWDVMESNLHRAAAEAVRDGTAIVEPDHGQPRENWAKIPPGGNMPSVHVNHKSGRFTSHGEVCYAPSSGGITLHPYWGDAKNWWPGGQIVAAAAVAPAQNPGGCTACEGDNYPTVAVWYESAQVKPSDFHEHVKTLKELADGCDVVAELSTWNKPALVALAASSAKRVVSYAPRVKADWKRLTSLCGVRFEGFANLPIQTEPCDLLFLDTAHTMETVYSQLVANAEHVRRYFVIHTTGIYGETGDDGSPGVLGAIRKFLFERSEWTSVRHDPNNYGMVVLSRDDRDKKQPPGKIRRALNFAKASAKHLANGLQAVPDDVFAARIELCVMCPERFHDMCGACGCPISDKASWASEDCGRVKLNDPNKPPLWMRYNGFDSPGVFVIPTAEPVTDVVTVGYDMDGVLSTGRFRPAVPFVVVSGRLEGERAATLAELEKLNLKPVAVYLRSVGGYGDGVEAGKHKAAIIRQLKLKEFYEDNAEQIEVIRAWNPDCQVVQVGN